MAEPSDAAELATVELLGALAYGQLRSFEATARLIALAPDVRTADTFAETAHRELLAYQALRDHLAERTELPAAVMDRQKSRFDAFFDHAPLGDWFDASVFFALGRPIASDFARALAPMLDRAAAEVVTATLVERGASEREAIARLAPLLADPDARKRAQELTADLLGRALTSYQAVVNDTDALRVLLASDTGSPSSADQRVRRLAIEVLARHRRRSVELGLEELDDVR